ncbi:hypothetical protein [Paenibacillus eucommiae]|uniref:Uncharacterized protein n=1 Tax=Paenibacillus eucommiae TaxID=1355755 RepID=A0ABS4ILT2_9BACL|nr:hypothetical protein [Paenibacillus eucommiae]MBP1988530.1 hypothetical protein [Paenibacillus eucommiae]
MGKTVYNVLARGRSGAMYGKNRLQCACAWPKWQKVWEKPSTMCLRVAEVAECTGKTIHNVLARGEVAEYMRKTATLGQIDLLIIKFKFLA